MKWFKRAALVLAGCAVLLGVTAVTTRSLVDGVWPQGPVTFQVPPAPWPQDPGGPAKLEALRGALEGLKSRAWLRTYVGAELPADPPAGGWPRHPEVDTRIDAFAAAGGLGLPAPRLDTSPPQGRLFFDLMDAERLRRVRALEHFRAGRHVEAGRDLATCVRFAHVLQHAGGGLLPMATGLAVETAALRWFEQMRQAAPEAPALAEALRPVLAKASWPSAVAGALAGECAAAEDLFRRMGALSFTDLMAATGDQVPHGGALPSSWLFSWEKTRDLSNQRCNLALTDIARAPGARTWPEFESLAPDGLTRLGGYLDNPVGRLLLDIIALSWRGLVEREDEVRALRARLLKSM